MGTSKDLGGARGPKWTKVRRGATDYAKDGGGREAAGRLVSNFIDALGGSAVAATSQATLATAQNLAGFLGGVAEQGVSPALADLGLADLAGRPRIEVISALADQFAGAGGTLEEAPARKALVEVLNEVVPEDETIEVLVVTPELLVEILERFLAFELYYELDQWIADRLAKHSEPAEKERLDRDLRDYIVGAARLELSDLDVLGIDWRGEQGQAEVERIRAQIMSDLQNLAL